MPPSKKPRKAAQKPRQRSKRAQPPPEPTPSEIEPQEAEQEETVDTFPETWKPPKVAGLGKVMGRPKVELSRRDYAQAAFLKGLGLPDRLVAAGLLVSGRTFERRKADDPELVAALEQGLAYMAIDASLGLVDLMRGAQITKKSGKAGEADQTYTRLPDLAAIKYWEATRLGVREVMAIEHTIPGQADPNELSDEQVAQEIEGILSLGAERARRASKQLPAGTQVHHREETG